MKLRVILVMIAPGATALMVTPLPTSRPMRDRVDGDAAASQPLGGADGQIEHRALSRPIGRLVGLRVEARGAGDQYDATEPALLHARRKPLQQGRA
jgi:hypothetical protein